MIWSQKRWTLMDPLEFGLFLISDIQQKYKAAGWILHFDIVVNIFWLLCLWRRNKNTRNVSSSLKRFDIYWRLHEGAIVRSASTAGTAEAVTGVYINLWLWTLFLLQAGHMSDVVTEHGWRKRSFGYIFIYLFSNQTHMFCSLPLDLGYFSVLWWQVTAGWISSACFNANGAPVESFLT